ncbi:MAG: class IV adenylate cyclase, partial [Acidilobaceae archaeon]
HPCRNFLVTDEALRIRQRGDGVIELTYKGPREKSLDYKGRLELTTVVADENSLREILEALGFRSAIVVIKKRRSYGKNGVEISLDEVDGLGCFIEIEGGLNEIETIARELSLRKEDYVAETYAELLLALRDSNRSHPGY